MEIRAASQAHTSLDKAPERIRLLDVDMNGAHSGHLARFFEQVARRIAVQLYEQMSTAWQSGLGLAREVARGG